VDLKLEVVVLPVSDVDRAKWFYESLGWRVDADFSGPDWRVVQVTPPGSVQSTFLVVDDIQAARTALVGRGAAVSEVFHYAAGRGPRVSGPDPQGRSYFSFASFSDPDGNSWLLQEIKTRLPGRGLSVDVPTLTELLRETELHHGKYEPTAPKHHWSQWYSGYIVAREQGKTPEEAEKDGALQVESGLR